MEMGATSYVDELYAEACACIEQGLCYDETGDVGNALAFYDRSLLLIKEAENQKEYKKSGMYEMVVNGKKLVESRMNDLKKMGNSLVGSKNEMSEAELQKRKDEEVKKLKKQIEAVNTIEADLLYYIPEGVQLFIVEGESTSIPTYPSSLEIFQFSADQKKPENMQAKAFMRIGPWSYPLLPGQTPVLKNDFGAYLVPNPTPEHPNMFVGILLPRDLDKKDEEDFHMLLKQYTEIRTQELSRQLSKEEKEHLSQKIGNFLMKSGDYLAANISHVAEKTSNIVVDQSTRIRSNLTPDEEPMHVNPAVRYGIHYVHKSSKLVAKCTRHLLEKIGDMGMSIGKTLASGAEKHLGNEESGIVHGTIYVLGSGITSASTVWIALENASKTMARNIANETVDTVKHKWGDQASLTAHEALYAAGHTSLAALQLWDLGPRSIAGRAARKAGMQFVNDLHKKRSNPNFEKMEMKNI